MKKLLCWFAANARDLSWRRTLDPYAIWVSEIMLQQTQVSTVIPYWERWMRELPDIGALARASEQRVLKLWEGLGYYTRARNLHRAARTLNGAPFPREYEAVLALAGIGRYTAGAICSIAFNQPTPAVDGNVARVLSRVFASNEALWDKAQELVVIAARTRGQAVRAPVKISGACGAFNQAIMELGAVVCTPRQPRCDQCPLASVCRARKLECIEDFPAKPSRPNATHRRFAVFVYRHKGRYLVQQRPDDVVNARLWEFPSVELGFEGAARSADFQSAESPICNRLAFERSAECNSAIRQIENLRYVRLCSFNHTITRYRITVDAFLVQRRAAIAGKWLPLATLDQLPFSSAHRKILIALRTRNAI